MRKGWVKAIMAVFCVLLLNAGAWGCVAFGLWEYNTPQTGEHYNNAFYYRAEDEYFNMVTEAFELREQAKQDVLSAYSRQRLADLEEALDANGTNFRFVVYEAGKRDEILLENAGEPENWTDQVYGTYTRSISLWSEDEYGHGVRTRYVMEYGVAWPFTVQDEFAQAARWFETVEYYAPFVLTASILCLVVSLILLILLLRVAGRRPGREEVVLNWHDKIPYDLYLALQAGLIILAVASFAESVWYVEAYMHWVNVLWMVGSGAACSILVLALLMTTTTRIKARTIFRNTIIWRLCKLLWRGCRTVARGIRNAVASLPMMRRTVVIFVLYLIGTVVSGATIVLALPYQALVLYLLCRWTMQWKQMRAATQEIIAGTTSTKIEHEKFFPDLKEHALQLNDLGRAIDGAVEERIKSERLKSELITNVSHDLKTPLTSIINYVDLLKKEEIENPTAQEYIEVLDRKSQRLKKLTEDLVEASKASTGALSVNRERLGLVQLVRQAVGECGEKLTGAGLTLMVNLPGHELYIQADGRHVWRVLDNLLNNCAKYALEGTRVYLDVSAKETDAVITVKNVSREPLNIPAEQLMERFVRGDESRTTEGSGLGLSIARSLTDLQKGRFELDIDGDLFKATVTIPLMQE